MYKKILAISVMSVFVFSFVVAGVSAQTRVENKVKETAKKIEKKVERKITNRMATSTNATSTSSVASSRASSASTDLTCIKNALVTRENTIIGVFAGFASNMTNAHQVRLAELSNSLAFGGGGKTSVKEAWSQFKASSKEARKTWKEGNKSAWTDFEKAAKSCKQGGGKGVSGEDEGKGIDTSVSN